MKVHLRTFGCRANQYDTEAVRALVESAGHEIVPTAATADLAVFNSCAVTGEAERDLRKAVRRSAASNPRLRSVVIGCAAALPASQPAIRALPTVEHVFGGAALDEVAAALGITRTSASTAQTSVRAVLRIQDGCDAHCTFCATTMARGANRSRPLADLVREASNLAAFHPEIVITGTHIGSFGQDIGTTLGALMRRLVEEVPGVRFRLSSIEATEVSADLVELFCDTQSCLAPHLHAPLQSGSDRLLRRMGRHWYTSNGYAEAIERIASRSPVLGLGADVIVGFPGESDADFRATVDVVNRLPFTYLHVFTYSARPATAAIRLPDPVDATLARERSTELREIGSAKAAAYAASRLGSTADVIVVGAAPTREGITEDYLTVRVPHGLARGTRLRMRLGADAGSLTAA